MAYVFRKQKPSTGVQAMMPQEKTWTVRWIKSITEVDPSQWDRLARPLATPLLEWPWLHALEASGSIAPASGWHPLHLTLWQGGRLIGAAPLYLKTHSAGEFVFDHLWARLAGDLNETYYPKLVGMSPATPAVAYRFLMDDGVDHDEAQAAMFRAIDTLCSQTGITACQFNFVDPDWSSAAVKTGYLTWRHQSYLWRNTGCRSFEDYLKPFRSTQRRNIRRERRRMDLAGITIRTLTGGQIPSQWAGLMYRCYLNTNTQYGPWAAKFLNCGFFEEIFRTYRHRLLVVTAHRRHADTPLALSMLVHKRGQLIGRYWGSTEQVRDLHFNLCFYAPIEWAIRNGIETFDPGAGSEHKLFRGFGAVLNLSLHRFYQPGLKALFQRYINGINIAEQANIDDLNQRLPFART